MHSCAQLLQSYLTNSLQPYGLAHQAPLSMGFSRQEYWSGLPCHLSRDLPYPGIEPASPALQADSSLLSHYGNPSVTIRMRLIWVYFFCFMSCCCCLFACQYPITLAPFVEKILNWFCTFVKKFT